MYFRHLVGRSWQLCNFLKAPDFHLIQLFKLAGVNDLPGESKSECVTENKIISETFVKAISEQVVYVE